VRLVLKYVGKIIGMVGAAALIAAIGGLIWNDGADHFDHFIWSVVFGVSLLVVGISLIKCSSGRT
jgi:hypothetical protein